MSVDVIERNARRIGSRGAAAAAAIAAAGTLLLPIGVGLLVLKALLIGGPILLGLALRMGVVSVASRSLRSPVRRVALRWTARGLWFVGLAGWTQAIVPFVGVVAAPLTILLLTAATASVARVTVERDARGEKLRTSEKLLLAFLVLLACALVAAVALVGATIGWTAAWWAERASP